MRELQRVVHALLVGLLLVTCASSSALAETETKTWTQTTGTYNSTLPGIQFSMVSVPITGHPNYSAGSGSAHVRDEGTSISIHFQAEGMARAHFTLILTVNGTSHLVANMTTSFYGETEAESYLPLAAGTYVVGLSVLDTSSFSAPTTVMVSNPTTQLIPVGQIAPTSTATTVSVTQSISTVHAGYSEDDGVRRAINSSFIPAVVDVGESSSLAQVNDKAFSVSVGNYQQNGYLVSISGYNVTGPRALLVNMSSSQSRNLFLGHVLITLDGSIVQQASNLSQVLRPQAGDPPRFILILTSVSLWLLITIPHFSSHTIVIVPVIAAIASTLTVNLPVLVLSVAFVTILIAITYSKRTRVDV